MEASDIPFLRIPLTPVSRLNRMTCVNRYLVGLHVERACFSTCPTSLISESHRVQTHGLLSKRDAGQSLTYMYIKYVHTLNNGVNERQIYLVNREGLVVMINNGLK